MNSTVYKLTLYKFTGELRYPKNIKTLETESYHMLGEDLIYVYYSKHMGVLFKNTTSKITERFADIRKIKFLDSESDFYGNLILAAITDNYVIIKYFSQDSLDYLTITKSIKCSNIFIIKYDQKIFCVYMNSDDNKLYYVNSEDNFEKSVLLHDSSFKKQRIVNSGYDKINNKPSVYLEVEDNSLLFNNGIVPLVNNKTFIEIPTSHKFYQKEV